MHGMNIAFLGDTPDPFTEIQTQKTTKRFPVPFPEWFHDWRNRNKVEFGQGFLTANGQKETFEDAVKMFNEFSANSQVTWKKDLMRDVLDNYSRGIRHEALDNIIQATRYDQGESVEAWHLFLTEMFPSNPALAIAGWQHSIWQIKRKMRGMKVYDHSLLNIRSSGQGTGKSELVKSLKTLLTQQYFSESTANVFSDIRFAEVFEKNFVIFLDELDKIGAKGSDEVKNKISADYVQHRHMTTTKVVPLENRSTMIGTSNPSLADIYRDPTGNRRFIELEASIPENIQDRIEKIKALDWAAIFRTVDEAAESPYRLHIEMFKAHQDEMRQLDMVEVYFQENALVPEAGEGKLVPVSMVLQAYNEFCKNRGAPYAAIRDSKAFKRRLTDYLPTVAATWKKIGKGVSIALVNFQGSSALAEIEASLEKESRLSVVNGGVK